MMNASLSKLIVFAILVVAPAYALAIDKSWKAVSDFDGIIVYEKDNLKSDLVALRAEAIIDAKINKVCTVLADHSRKKEWMPRLKSIIPIKVISPYERFEYSESNIPWPFTDREFLTYITGDVTRDKKKQLKTVFIKLRSVEETQLPKNLTNSVPKTKNVRAQLHYSHINLEKVDENSTKLTIEFVTDPRGAIPTWIVNIVQRDWPRNLILALKKQVKRDDVVSTYY